jgi:hypothetical protein
MVTVSGDIVETTAISVRHFDGWEIAMSVPNNPGDKICHDYLDFSPKI